MSSSEEGSKFIPFPPGIIMVRPANPDGNATSEPKPEKSKSVRATWIVVPSEAFSTHHSLQAQERTIARLNQEKVVSSPWETARTQAVRLTPPSEPSEPSA